MTAVEFLAWCKKNNVEVRISYDQRFDECTITMVDYARKSAYCVRKIISYERLLEMNKRDCGLEVSFMLNKMLDELRSDGEEEK